MNELTALTILSHIPQLGSIKIRTLLQQFGSAVEVLDTDPILIADLPGFGPKVMQHWESWKSNETWKENLDLAEKHLVSIIPFTSPEYPKSLLEIHDHPILLYIKGELKRIDQRSIAIVGTRNASIYGLSSAQEIAQSLAAKGFTIVSGLARGIDTAAHQGAIKQGRTLAVIGSGLASIYPRENKDLANAIAENGAVISEFPMLTPPDRQNFPQRNRIVSGMTLGTLLIEAPVKSGAMITMDRALTHGKKLFALPGRIDNDNFRGNHLLIKSKQAQLVENAEDIAQTFDNLFGTYSPTILAKKSPFLLSEEENTFWQMMPREEFSIEELMSRTKLPIIKINILLISLIMKQAIKEYPGKIYKKIGI